MSWGNSVTMEGLLLIILGKTVVTFVIQENTLTRCTVKATTSLI